MWRLVILILFGTGCGDERSRVMLKESAQGVPVYAADPAPMNALDLGSSSSDASADAEFVVEIDAVFMMSDGSLGEADMGVDVERDQAISDLSDSAALKSDASAD